MNPQVPGISGNPINNSNTDRAVREILKCGHGDQCAMSGVKMLHGPEATVASVGVRRFEDDAGLLDVARAFGRKIREAVEQAAAKEAPG